MLIVKRKYLFIFLILFMMVSGAGAWWDTDWEYRKEANVEENSGNDLSDHQVLFTVDTDQLISEDKMNSDCSDMRWINSDDSSKLDYWIESGCGTSTTEVWVKIPSLQASNTKTIYFYHGNNSALDESDGKSTMAFYEDFADGDYSGWSTYGDTKTSGGSYDHSIDSNEYQRPGYSAQINADGNCKNPEYDGTNAWFERELDLEDKKFVADYYSKAEGGQYDFCESDVGGQDIEQGDIRRNNDEITHGASCSYDSACEQCETPWERTTEPFSGGNFILKLYLRASDCHEFTVNWDQIVIRSYADPQPATSFSQEEIYENKVPNEVNDPENPKNGELISDSSTIFNVSVSDPDGDDLEVKFRNNVSNQTSAGTASGVSSGNFATVEKNLVRGETYKWWVNVSDQQNYTKSGPWSFYVNSLPSLDSFEPSDGSIIQDDAIYLNITGSDEESLDLYAYYYDEDGNFLGKDSGPETDKLVSDEWDNLDIGQVYTWEVRLSDGEENRSYGLFNFIRSTGSNYRLETGFDIGYSSIISSPDSSEIFLVTIGNNAGVTRSVTTYLEGVNSVFSESGTDSISYDIEPYGEKEMIVRVEPEEKGEKTLSVKAKDENLGINSTEKIPVTVRENPAVMESREVPDIGIVQLSILVLSAAYIYTIRL
ncbi:MAG: hypothetical protein BRC29_04050 [Nanohaloarchaea archaeon SW_7_43_1]|nr:MAG: hypothetical protein BRC29_04050 [Nanohaloarchaea archaeon SW_7_43_1]